MNPVELLTCFFLIAISAYLSASEIALFSLSRFQLRSLKENFRPVHRRIKRLLSDPGGLLITILVTNEVINITLSTYIAGMVAKARHETLSPLESLPHWALETLLGIAITTPIVLILCEVTPKVIAARINQLIATLTVGPVTLLYTSFKPIRFVLVQIIQLILKRPFQTSYADVGKATPGQESILKESDFLLMVEEGHKEGAIQETELELIRNVFELDHTTVAEVYTPLSQVLSLSVHTTVKEALAAIRSQKYSRIPIYGSHKKDIVGILYSKDLLRTKLQEESLATTAATVMRKPFYVSSTISLHSLFRRFKQHKTHMAIVRNSDSEAIGIITMNDILDALFENLFTEEEEGTSHHPYSRREISR